ncbi:MAG TPA: hypothetical protein VD835_10605 [Pyrinomonadaceae bacterium]|nr:hypothetical protein [Pyrinomonadaceae bacterium]
MLQQIFKSAFFQTLCGALLFIALLANHAAAQPPPQQQQKPLTSQELVRLVYQLPAQPQKRDEIVEEIRRRGIDFELTTGLRGIVATKSGNDALLRRTLEEAARRRTDPAGAAARPSEAEALDVLERARKATLAAAGAMPDFVVRQLVRRSYARGETRNWTQTDQLTVAASYRESAGGEQYKLLSINGLPASDAPKEQGAYEEAGGSTTTGEFASLLITLFKPESETDFQPADTDTLRGRRTLVYNFVIKKDKQPTRLRYGRDGATRDTVAGLRGRVWIDRELFRVLRAEYTTTEVAPDFPIRRLDKTIDLDWVTINEKQYLLPVAAEAVFTTAQPVTYYDPRAARKVTEVQTYQSRNEIRFRNYQRFGSEVKIIEEGDFTDEEEPPAKKP